MSKERKVVISTSGLNSYGFRVLTSGIDIRQYQRNPILLWMHNRPYMGTKNEVLPIGTVKDIQVDGDRLTGTLVFDEKDEFAKQIQDKWDAGILKMVSAGLDVKERSSDPSVLLPGQTRETVTKSKLVEVSVVDIGANDEALALRHSGKMLCLADNINDSVLNDIINPIKQQLNTFNMKTILIALGLPETATENEALAKIEALQGMAAQAVQLKKEREEQQKRALEEAVDEAVRLQKITADKKQMFIGMGEKIGLAQLKETLSLMGGAVRPSDVINQASANGATEYKKLSEVPADQVALMRENDIDTYKRLYKAEYGIDLPKD